MGNFDRQYFTPEKFLGKLTDNILPLKTLWEILTDNILPLKSFWEILTDNILPPKSFWEILTDNILLLKSSISGLKKIFDPQNLLIGLQKRLGLPLMR